MLVSSANTALFFSSLDEIPAHIWVELSCSKNIYFHPAFLKSFEKNHTNISFSYVVLLDKKKQAIAFASIKIIDFYLNSIKTDFGLLRRVGESIGVISAKKALKLLICGNLFVSGEHGIFIKENQNKKEIIREIAKNIHQFINSNHKLKNQIDAFLLKDFPLESLSIANELKKSGYHAFSVEPNMKLEIQEHWINFNAYLGAMKTKFRVKAKRALTLSKALNIEEVTFQNIDKQLPKMTALYEKVAGNATFDLGLFNLETYRDLKKQFGNNYILKTYWLEDEIVGFVSGIVNEKSLDAHFVGIDYKRNRTHAVYQRMLYDYVEIAIQLKLKTVNFGRTASEIKSSIGAVPENLTMYLRHKKTVKNKILKLFLQRVQPTPFDQKFPFKK